MNSMLTRILKIQSGAFGIVYLLQYGHDQLVVKVDVDFRDSVKRERKFHLDLYKDLSEKGKQYIPKPLKDQSHIESIPFWEHKSIHAMEYVHNAVTLQQFIHENSQNNAKLQKVFENVKTALKELWKVGFIHADLHLENVLVQPNLKIKIVDFGYSRRVPPPTKMTDRALRTWFNKHWQTVLNSWNLPTMNPNVHLYGLYKSYPKTLNMYAKRNKSTLQKLHKKLQGTIVKASIKKTV